MSYAASIQREAAPDQLGATDTVLAEILDLVHSRVAVDLRVYRQAGVLRRVTNRLKMAGCHDLTDYRDFLTREPSEARHLVEYVTIKWSRFFRDSYLFDRLRDAVLPDLISRRESELAFWSAGCARGEEPYSLALLLGELVPPGEPTQAAICGTDIDETALAAALRRVYPETSLSGLPAHLVDRYFEPQPGRFGRDFSLRAEVGEGVSFLRHDLLSEKTPLEGCVFHLVLCRNVLIYFQRQVHHRVLDLLALSLAPDGYLCLGEAEQIPSSHLGLFDVVDRRGRIYRKK